MRTAGVAALALVAVGGCKGPSDANVKLRRENQELAERVAALESRMRAVMPATTQTATALSGAQLAGLPFTVVGVTIGTSAVRVEDGASALRLEVLPVDADGDGHKAAGTVEVELVALTGGARLGAWAFSTDELRAKWVNRFLIEGFLIDCPLGAALPDGELTASVTFRDALTGRVVTAQKEVERAAP